MRLAPDIQDDGFREIQLNGKQLVFLFMAATVVSVVIFLCGVLVGRGVRAERGATAGDASALNAVTAVETTPQQIALAAIPTPAGSDPTTAAPPPAVDDLTYFNRLDKQTPPLEELKPAPETRAAAAPASVAPATPPAESAAPATPPPTVKEPAPLPPEPGGQGYALQVAALRDRVDAEAIAKRLASKGYAAYVLAPARGTPTVYRVRIGKFKTRREAETMAAKLHKEEQFNPWITR